MIQMTLPRDQISEHLSPGVAPIGDIPSIVVTFFVAGKDPVPVPPEAHIQMKMRVGFLGNRV